MISQFSEIGFLSDRDLVTLLNCCENETWLVALYNCDPFVRERVLRQLSYVGWKCFEIDWLALAAPDIISVGAAQAVILNVVNSLIVDRELEDYLHRKVV